MKADVEAAITRVAIKTGVDRTALERLIWNESRGNPNVGFDRSGYSAGIGQISKLIWRTYSDIPFSEASKPERFEDNITVAARYLKHNYNHYGNWKLALQAYNEGETIMDKILKGQRQLSPITVNYTRGFN